MTELLRVLEFPRDTSLSPHPQPAATPSSQTSSILFAFVMSSVLLLLIFRRNSVTCYEVDRQLWRFLLSGTLVASAIDRCYQFSLQLSRALSPRIRRTRSGRRNSQSSMLHNAGTCSERTKLHTCLSFLSSCPFRCFAYYVSRRERGRNAAIEKHEARQDTSNEAFPNQRETSLQLVRREVYQNILYFGCFTLSRWK